MRAGAARRDDAGRICLCTAIWLRRQARASSLLSPCRPGRNACGAKDGSRREGKVCGSGKGGQVRRRWRRGEYRRRAACREEQRGQRMRWPSCRTAARRRAAPTACCAPPPSKHEDTAMSAPRAMAVRPPARKCAVRGARACKRCARCGKGKARKALRREDAGSKISFHQMAAARRHIYMVGCLRRREEGRSPAARQAGRAALARWQQRRWRTHEGPRRASGARAHGAHAATIMTLIAVVHAAYDGL